MCAMDSSAVNRTWWDRNATSYHEEHPEYLGADSPTGEFYWCPEMLHERDAKLLGPLEELAGRTVVEVGCGSAPCSRWLAAHAPAARVYAFDISQAMLRSGGAVTSDHGLGQPAANNPGGAVLLQADALAMPFADASVDVAFSAFGALPFVAEPEVLLGEVARILKPGGRWVCAVNHPMRWIFPDDPGVDGLTVYTSYFDRSPYVETDTRTGEVTYVEHHRTLGDRIAEIIGAGLVLDGVLEPEWPEDLTTTWGQWSPLRGQYFPGTIIFQTHKPLN